MILLVILLAGISAPAAAQASASAGMPVILEFGRPGCPVCKLMEEILTDLKQEEGARFAVRFLSMDRDDYLFRKYRVTIVPTQVFLDAAGREVFRHEGLFPRDRLRRVRLTLNFIGKR
jgi:thioredoxin 1